MRKKHFARAEQVAHDVHAVHQWPFYDLDGAPAPIEDLLAHLFGVFHDKRCNAVHQCVRQALLDRLLAPGQVFFLARTAALDDLGRSEEHTSELQSLMRISYAVVCLKKK